MDSAIQVADMKAIKPRLVFVFSRPLVISVDMIIESIFAIVPAERFCFPLVYRLDIMVFDIGRPADWVKVNVKRFVSFSHPTVGT